MHSFPVVGAWALAIAFVALLLIRPYYTKHGVFLQSLPWVGSRSGWLWLKAIIRSIKESENMVNEGYEPYTKKDKLFVLPTLAAGPVVILPPSQLHLLNRPESQVAAHETSFEIIQPPYTMARNKEVCESTIAAGFGIVWRHMVRSRDAGRFSSVITEELAPAFDDAWGCTQEWSTFKVFETCAHIIARTANRTYFGLPLCRDEALLDHSKRYAEAVFGSAAMISVLPAWIRPIFGHLIAIPAQRHLAACRKLLEPYVQARLDQTQRGEAKSFDILQLLIEDAQKNRPDELNATHITYSLLAINQSSIYSTAYGLSNCVLDLYSSPGCNEFVAGIREECERITAEHGDLESIEALNKLYRLDSCIKESLRISGFNTIASPPGVELDVGNGTIPQGVRIGAPIQSIHFDNDLYPGASQFDAFRFSRPFEDYESGASSSDDARREILSTRVTKDFLPWGFGKHACPGRWNAVNMMKSAMVYILQNYDIQTLDTRPKNVPILNVLLPAMDATIQVRRRTSLPM